MPSIAEQAALQHFTDRATQLMTTDTHAISVAVMRRGSVIFNSQFGTDTQGAALTSSSRFRIASISKVPLAMVVLQLVDAGTLMLDQPFVEQWTTGVPTINDPAVRSITVRQLLQHTSGFSNLRDVFFDEGASDWRTAARLAAGSTLQHTPGTMFRYSNANYVILATLVEQHTGRTIEQALTSGVFAPLGITDAVLSGTSVTDTTGPAYVVTAERNYMEVLGPAGAWCLSAADTARILASLLPSDDPLVRPDLVSAMRTAPAVPDPDEDWRYGMGLLLFRDSWGHTGSIEDALTFAVNLPNGYTVAILTAGDVLADGEAVKAAFQSEIDGLSAFT